MNLMHLAVIGLPLVLILIAGVLVGFRAYRLTQMKQRTFVPTPPAPPVPPAPVMPTPQSSPGWQGQPVDQRCLELFQGGPLRPVHQGDGVADATVSQVSTLWHRGYSVTAFTYGYTDAGTRHQYTVVSVPLPAAVPPLQLQPVAGAAPSVPFDQAFTVQTEDPQGAGRILTPAVTGWLAADPRTRQFPLYFEGTVAGTWQMHQGAPSVEFANQAADLLAELVDRVRAQ